MNAFVVMSNGQPVRTAVGLEKAKQEAAKFVKVSRTLWIDTIAELGLIKRWSFDKSNRTWDDGVMIRSQAKVTRPADSTDSSD